MVSELVEIERADAVMRRVDQMHANMLQRIAAKTKAIPEESHWKKEPVAEQVWSIPGFGTGARVQTSFGLVPVELLRVGDPLKTKAGHFLKVAYVDKIRLDRRFLLTHPEAQPITIPKDAFGAGSPCKNMCLSGAQEIVQPDRFDQKMGTRASSFVGQRRIARNLSGYFDYFVFHCIEPCTVCVNGIWASIKPSTPDTSIE